jgi:lysophospholipase L1-like esterase
MRQAIASSKGLIPFQNFFGILGYSVFCFVIVAALLEFVAFDFWSIRQFLHRNDPQVNEITRSPSYQGQPWAKEFLKEERGNGKSQQEYIPFRIWGPVIRHGQYINVDRTDLGLIRRTINPVRKECAGMPITKIWVFGGSTVYGSGAPDWGTVPSYISAALERSDRNCTEVSNLGVVGYVTNQELILLTEKLKAGLRPNAVIFFDGGNESDVGGFSPGIATAHTGLERIKLGVENPWQNKLIFLSDLYSARLVRGVLSRFRSNRPVRLSDEELRRRALATLANYEGNLRIIEALANAYGFKAYFFWQPSLFYGSKPAHPFEQELVRIKGSEFERAIAAVYEEAERRSAISGSFVFLGRLFDQVTQPVYVDRNMHLSPLGNEIAAQAIVRMIEVGGEKGAGLSGQQDGIVTAK